MIWGYVAMWVVSIIISEAIAVRNVPDGPSAAGFDEFQAPTASAARAIPVVWGDVLVHSPNLVWYGDFDSKPVRERTRVGLWSKRSITVGHRYFIGLHYVVCHSPADSPARIVELQVEDRSILETDGDPGDYWVSAKNLYGGRGDGGGIVGRIDVLDGDPEQNTPPYLVDQLGEIQPAYRGVASLVARRIEFGEAPQLRPWAMRIERYPEFIAPDYAQIGRDANPAIMIAEGLTNSDWGLGQGIGRIDESSFQAAAETLHDEGFGLSLAWMRESSVHDMIAELSETIDAALFDDPVTGLWRLELIRDDYDFEELDVLDESNIAEIHEFSRPALDDLINELSLTYTDRASGEAVSITIHDIGLERAQGGVPHAASSSYRAVRDPELAARLAERDLRVRGRPLARVELSVLSHIGMQLRPGSVVRWSWSAEGIEDMVLRISRIDYGNIQEGRIRISAAEDAFGVGEAIYAAPPDSEWTALTEEPQPVEDVIAVPMPYWHQQTVVTDFSLAGEQSGLMVAAPPPQVGALGFDVQRRDDDAWETAANDAPFADSLTLDSAVDFNATEWSVRDWPPGEEDDLEADFEIGSAWQVDDEIVRLDAIDREAGTITVGRGCLDTVPAAHGTDARVTRIQDAGLTGPEIADDIDIRLITVAVTGRLEEDEAPTITVDLEPRHLYPYPPGNFRINGDRFPEVVNAPLEATWSHRDRTADEQLADLIDTNHGSIGPEDGTTYAIRITDLDADAVIFETDEITGTSYSDPDGSDTTTPTSAPPNIRLELWSTRDGYDSWQKHDAETQRRGYGFAYLDADENLIYGGFASA